MTKIKMPLPTMSEIQEASEQVERPVSAWEMVQCAMFGMKDRIERLGGEFLFKDLEVADEDVYANISIGRLPTLEDVADSAPKGITAEYFARKVVDKIAVLHNELGDKPYVKINLNDVIVPSQDWSAEWLEAYISSLLFFSYMDFDAASDITDSSSGEIAVSLSGDIRSTMLKYAFQGAENLEYNNQNRLDRVIARHGIDKKITQAVDLIKSDGLAASLIGDDEFLASLAKDRIGSILEGLVSDAIEDIRFNVDWFEKDCAQERAETVAAQSNQEPPTSYAYNNACGDER